ncbi:MAG: glycosyltransferase family 4 protein [Candidatus Goldbacteria bacterium]|nr:glycosyltransferase family 4 protein [Candidatus Goldiibacteriota bacterium]
MKILFVSHSSVLKFHQQKLLILAKKYHHNITLVTPPYWIEGGVKVPAYTGNKEINYIIGKTIIFEKRFFHFYLNPDEIVKKVMPDIIHIEEEPFTPVCWQFTYVARKRNIKTIFYTWENIDRRHNFIYSQCEKYNIKNCDAAIAGNFEAKMLLAKKGFIKIIDVIPQYGVNLSDFKEKIIEGKAEYNITYIGRLTKEKGIEILLDAIYNIQNIKLHIVGTGALLPKIKAKVKRLDLQDKVFFHSHIERENIPEFLNKMDILVLPSITTNNWKEQFGRVIIEAFAAKVAVVGSDSGAIPEVIGDAGIIFKEGNSKELSNKLKDLMEDGELFRRCINKGYERVKNNYTNEVIAEKIDKFYRKIL